MPIDRPGLPAAPSGDAGTAAPRCRPFPTDMHPTEVPRCNLRLDDAMERCGDGLDNDCDGLTDEGCCARSCEGDSPHCDEVSLPGGTFTQGEMVTAGEPTPSATPVHSGISVSPFRMDAYEVTVARFRRFVAAGMPAPPAGAVMFPRNAVLRASAWTTRAPKTEMDATGSLCNWTPSAGMWESGVALSQRRREK